MTYKEEYATRWLSIVERCYDIALRCKPHNARNLFGIGKYWVWRSNMFAILAKTDAKCHLEHRTSSNYGIMKFQDLFKRTLVISPKKWKEIVDIVWFYYPDEFILLDCVPYENKLLNDKITQFIKNKRISKGTAP